MDSSSIKKLAFASPENGSVVLDEFTLAGLKKMPVDIFDNVYLGEVKSESLSLCIDVRGFSDFLSSNDERTVFTLIKSFTSNLLSCVNQVGYGCSYYKLLGDGALVIWDQLDSHTLNEAVMVFQTYTEFLEEELFKPHKDLSLAGALVLDKVYKYEISAEASQLKYRDYVGYGINLACRLQELAKGGELIVNSKLVEVGAVNAQKRNSERNLKYLRSLKGLKKADRESLYFYSEINPDGPYSSDKTNE